MSVLIHIKGRRLMMKEKERLWLFIYLGMIIFQLLANVAGNLYISANSKEQRDIVIASADQYKEIGFDAALEISQEEVKRVGENALAFLHNLIWGQIVLLVISAVGFIPAAISKYIDKEISSEYQILAWVCMIGSGGAFLYNLKGVLEQISMYNQVYGYFGAILNIIEKLMNTL